MRNEVNLDSVGQAEIMKATRRNHPSLTDLDEAINQALDDQKNDPHIEAVLKGSIKCRTIFQKLHNLQMEFQVLSELINPFELRELDSDWAKKLEEKAKQINEVFCEFIKKIWGPAYYASNFNKRKTQGIKIS